MRPAAFFDLDLTLIDVNSGLLWAQHERDMGNISRGQMLRAVFWHGMYKLSLIDMDVAIDRAMEHYRGISGAELEARTRAWFDREIAPRYRSKAAEAVKRHRDDGLDLVILTNSSCYEATRAAEHWGFDAILANSFPSDDDGRLLGTVHKPLCYGAGKVTHATEWATENDIDLDRSFFYTDSYSDLPMLERVGEPRVVTPDIRLRREASRRGWPIFNW